MNGKSTPVRLLMTADAIGGVWQYSVDLARALAPLSYETTLALLGPAPTVDQRRAALAVPGLSLLETGCTLDWLAESPEEVAHAARQVAALAADMGADLVQLNQPALAASVSYPAPVLTVSHSCLATWWQAVEQGPWPTDFAWRVALHGAGLRAAAHVVAPTWAFAQATQLAYDLRARPTAVHNGRSVARVAERPMEAHAFTAGRLWDRGKDLATADRAAARLTFPFLAAGPRQGPNGEQIMLNDIEPLDVLTDTDLADQLARRPVFVSTARYEPFGLAVLEAAAAGCALVLSDIPTFRELWDGAATFVACGDDQGFAAAIERIVADPAQRLHWGERARDRAGRFTPERMAAAMATIYAALLSGHTGRNIPVQPRDRAA